MVIWTRKHKAAHAARCRTSASPNTSAPAAVAVAGVETVGVVVAQPDAAGAAGANFVTLYRRSPGLLEDYMKLRIPIIFISLLWVVPLMAQQVSVNYNHGVSFAQFHTYAWAPNNANQIQNSILAQVAQQDIENAMAQKGFQKVAESQNPDLILTASGGERAQTSWNTWGMRGIGGGMGSISPQQNIEGTMIVSLYNPKTQELVWRGIAEDTLSANGNKNQQMVEKAVQKMFKQWPRS